MRLQRAHKPAYQKIAMAFLFEKKRFQIYKICEYSERKSHEEIENFEMHI